MYRRYYLAITVAALSAFLLSPTAQADWSPLQKDVQAEVGSVEPSPELDHFRQLRKEVTEAQMAEQQKQKKGKGLLGRFRHGKGNAAETSATEEPAEETVETPAEAESADAAMAEPGTEPAKELMEAAADSDDEDSAAGTDDEKDAPKKAKQVPGQKPTEDTNDAGYFIKRAQSFTNQKDFQSALNYIDKALELQPQNWDAWYTKALVYQLAGYDAAAARRYLKLIEHRPDMIEAHIGMGMLYRKHNNWDLAQKEYEEAINLKFYSFPAHYNLANLFMDQKKFEQALKEYKVCLKLQPSNALVHNNMGVIFQNRNYLEEAMDEFKKASNLDPANQMYMQNLTAVKTQLSKKNTKHVTM